MSGGTAPRILYIGTGLRRFITFTPQGKNLRYPLDRRQGKLDTAVAKRNNLFIAPVGNRTELTRILAIKDVIIYLW
jgi:hypothetical protein